MKTNPNDLVHPESNAPALTSLTKREYFAALAMQGLATKFHMKFAAEKSCEFADALIEELNKGTAVKSL